MGGAPPRGSKDRFFTLSERSDFAAIFALVHRCTEKGVAVRLVRLFDALGVPKVVFHCICIVFLNVGPVGHFGAQERRRIMYASIWGRFWNPRGGPKRPKTDPKSIQHV